MSEKAHDKAYEEKLIIYKIYALLVLYSASGQIIIFGVSDWLSILWHYMVSLFVRVVFFLALIYNHIMDNLQFEVFLVVIRAENYIYIYIIVIMQLVSKLGEYLWLLMVFSPCMNYILSCLKWNLIIHLGENSIYS